MRIVALALLTLTTPAIAGVLPVEGIFGNASGCRMYLSGEQVGDFQLLTPDTFTSPEAGCDFEALESSDAVSFIVVSVCSPGGKQQVVVSDRGQDGYSVALGGEDYGPFKACPVTSIDGPEIRL